jgi:hypothetical protein
VANSTNDLVTKGDGIYIFNSDLTPVFPTNRTGGYDFELPELGGTDPVTPWRLTVGLDDTVYICDWSDRQGNLIATDPDVSTHWYVLKPLETNSVTGAIGVRPVGSNNNHGSVQAVAVRGSTNTGNLVVYTVDEDYSQDPAATMDQMNSVWELILALARCPGPTRPINCWPSPTSITARRKMMMWRWGRLQTSFTLTSDEPMRQLRVRMESGVRLCLS